MDQLHEMVAVDDAVPGDDERLYQLTLPSVTPSYSFISLFILIYLTTLENIDDKI